MVERPDQLGVDQLPEHVDSREEDVERDLAGLRASPSASVIVLKVVI